MAGSIHSILKQYWGYDQFRPLQEDIITSVLEGRDTLALLPTGGGKSICFQVPALAREGMCIVVSPLIALMKDQVENLKKRDIPAAAVYSGMSQREISYTLDNCIQGAYRFLYVSPERLKTENFRERLRNMKVNILAVDEAHCVSQWGYDFRPEYLQIAELREYLPGIPVLALTASATPDVVTDIQEKLRFKKRNVFVKSFERPNLSYVVYHTEDKYNRMVHMLSRVKGTALVYVRNRRKTQEIAQVLANHHIRADFYHAGLPNEVRTKKQDQWIHNNIRVMVCTNAFGMGIDKPDVRLVIHFEMPESLESYYQEAGRAGRDGQKAYAVLLYNKSDEHDALERLETTYPHPDQLVRVYQALCNFYSLPLGATPDRSFDFSLQAFCDASGMKPVAVYPVLKALEQCDLIVLNEHFFEQSKLHFLLHVDALYKIQVEQPALDPIIKLLLRSYGGLFDQYVAIREDELARRGKVQPAVIVKYLNRLHQLGIVDYKPQTSQPQLSFVSVRTDARGVTYAAAFINERKKVAMSKLQSMLDYASNADWCRSKKLVAYFDQYGGNDCGVCDVCLLKKKLDLTGERFSELIHSIERVCRKEPVAIKELATQLKSFTEENVSEAVRFLLDNDKLHYNLAKQLEWKNGNHA